MYMYINNGYGTMTNQYFSTFWTFFQHRNCLRKAANLRGMYIFREENGDFLATWLSDFGLVETGLDHSPLVLQFASYDETKTLIAFHVKNSILVHCFCFSALHF